MRSYLLDKFVQHGQHVLFVGPTGTGKTVYVKTHLLNGLPDQYTSMFINFSAQTSANMTQVCTCVCGCVGVGVCRGQAGAHGPARPVHHRVHQLQRPDERQHDSDVCGGGWGDYKAGPLVGPIELCCPFGTVFSHQMVY
eukprot:277201-Chlamydomonas_euryale.AAC.1